MRSIKDEVNLNEKKILLRLDLNVPLNKGKITDTTRINKILPTLNYLLKQNSKIIILSHVGRPNGKVVDSLSLKPICEDLKNKLKENVKLVTKNIKEIDSKNLFTDPNEKIVMLENIRFYDQEEKNDEKFAKILSKFGDIYVNDAFSCSHRAHASVTKITNFIPSYCGLQMMLEINALKKVTSDIERPITCIIGGSKISTKINIIKNLVSKFENIIIVGGMANNILEYNGHNIGKSLKEENCEPIIKEILFLAKKHNCNIVYPKDVSVGKNMKDIAQIKKLSEINNDDLILDIGPETIKMIKSLIENSKTVLWNGPAGYFENQNFANGSNEIANKIKSMKDKVYSVAGGGDTIAVLNGANAFDQFNFISTAGGAFLEYLEGKEIPGITALN
jgi:phosphoglycerate kinase